MRTEALLLLLMTAAPATAQQEIRFGVLGLFHPKELILQQEGSQVLSVLAQGIAVNHAVTLNGETGHRQIVFRAEGDRVVAGDSSTSSWTAAARDGGAAAFRLTMPGKLHRVYRGRFMIQAHKGELLAVVTMDRETAVASIVGAEMVESAPMEALKAQAVAARSFLLAGPRHLNFEFCDTTHCQFLKSPPPMTSRVMSAVEATRGLVLAYRGKPLAAMYSSRCGGQTRTLRDVGLNPGEAYPYYSVRCQWCERHPATWQSRIGASGQPPQPGDERSRIAEARQWGWGAIPGSDFTATADGEGWRLEGHSVGHGVGMCQMGATGMARAGAGFREILSHYYPNTELIALP
ncbi:MAG: SpoIID/LytB domain-containing protein [Terracidiphilus sp.]